MLDKRKGSDQSPSYNEGSLKWVNAQVGRVDALVTVRDERDSRHAMPHPSHAESESLSTLLFHSKPSIFLV